MSKKYKQIKGNEMDAVKAYEASLKKVVEVTIEPERKIGFDEWWAARNPQLEQPNHVKEILLKDAKARGLTKTETMERWDWAARTYGLKF